VAIYRKEIKPDARASVATSRTCQGGSRFCPQCGKQKLDEGKFCSTCGGSLTEVGAMSDGTLDQNLLPQPKDVQQRTAFGKFIVSREDVEKRYALMPNDELTTLRRNDLTAVASSCLDQELRRRGIRTSAETMHPSSTVPQQVDSFWLTWKELLVVAGLILMVPILLATANGGGPDRIIAACSVSGTLFGLYIFSFFNRQSHRDDRIARKCPNGDRKA